MRRGVARDIVLVTFSIMLSFLFVFSTCVPFPAARERGVRGAGQVPATTDLRRRCPSRAALKLALVCAPKTTENGVQRLKEQRCS